MASQLQVSLLCNEENDNIKRIKFRVTQFWLSMKEAVTLTVGRQKNAYGEPDDCQTAKVSAQRRSNTHQQKLTLNGYWQPSLEEALS